MFYWGKNQYTMEKEIPDINFEYFITLTLSNGSIN